MQREREREMQTKREQEREREGEQFSTKRVLINFFIIFFN